MHADFYLVAGRARPIRVNPLNPGRSAFCTLSIGDQLHPENTLAYLRNVVLTLFLDNGAARDHDEA